MSDSITLEEAYNCATDFFRGIQYKTTFAGNSQLTLEEFEFVQSSNSWFITLGFVPVLQKNENEYTVSRHEYRTLQVNGTTKEIKSMKKGYMGYQEENVITVVSQQPSPETDWVRIVTEITEKRSK